MNSKKNLSGSPLRALFLSLSRMPPALMLLIIIGLAVLVTMMVNGRVSQREVMRAGEAKSGAYAAVVCTVHAIPAEQKIDKSMLSLRRLKEPAIFQDAQTSVPSVVGRRARNPIAKNAQVREMDLY